MSELAVGAQASHAVMAQLPALISVLGKQRFGATLMQLLHEACGADHCTLFSLNDGVPQGLVSFSRDGTDIASRQTRLYIERSLWRLDPLTLALPLERDGGGADFYRIRTADLLSAELRDLVYGPARVGERIILPCLHPRNNVYLSILRPDNLDAASASECDSLVRLTPLLSSVVERHSGLLSATPQLSAALTSLPLIESIFTLAVKRLPRREIEVCSRMLYGISSAGIALELGISEGTVLTYRKRAYQRLSIGCQREMLLWYVNEYGRQQAEELHAPPGIALQ